MKYFLKAIWLLVLFACAFVFFENRMTETLSDKYIETTDAGTSHLPVVSLDSDGANVGRLYGYTNELNALNMRECFVSVESDNALDIIIDERDSDIRRLLYSVYDSFTGDEVDKGTVNAFDFLESGKQAHIKLDCEIEASREYAVQITLITKESRRIYYYFRFKQYDEAYFKEKVDFIKEFSMCCLEKETGYIIPFLESTYRGEGTTWSHVDIYDSYYMVCWGNLKPTLVTDVTMTINELYKYIMVATLKYTVSLETASGTEYYDVTEKFRVNIGSNYVFLLNYERDLEASFNASFASIKGDQLKLGVSDTAKDLHMFASGDNNMMAFVRGNSLYYYNLPENKITTVYSLENGMKYPTEACQEHEIRILKMHENGDLTFMVTGYFNTGEYEGKTGILLFDYYKADNRIRELLYIPIAESYQHIKAETDGFAYMNDHDIFYFMAYNTIYSYNLSTGILYKVSDALITNLVFCQEKSYAAWSEEGKNDTVFLLFPETEELKTIRHADYDVILLYDIIGNNMVCGYGKLSDAGTYSDKTVYYPVSNVRIIDENENVLKDYHYDGYYVTEAVASETAISLTRVKKENGSYHTVPDDYMFINRSSSNTGFRVDVRITEQMMDEHYISLPSGKYLYSLPSTDVARVTVISDPTQVRIDVFENREEKYEVYSFGEILGIRSELHSAIRLADTIETVGIVMNRMGTTVWERGVQNKTAGISESTLRTARGFLANGFDDTLKLTGSSLSQVLYYVYKDLPVYAVIDEKTTYILTGYTPDSVTYENPVTGETVTEEIDVFSNIMEENGNVFRCIFN